MFLKGSILYLWVTYKIFLRSYIGICVIPYVLVKEYFIYVKKYNLSSFGTNDLKEKNRAHCNYAVVYISVQIAVYRNVFRQDKMHRCVP